MKKLLLFIAAGMACAACTTGNVPEAKDSITVDIAEKGAGISPNMYGIFFEEINHSGDGGLLAEMVENKSFEDLEMPEGYYAEGDRIYTPKMYHHSRQEKVTGDYRWTTEAVPGWVLEGAATMALTKEDPMFASAPNSLKVSVDGEAVLANDGFWGMYLQEGKSYEFRTIVKPCEGSSVVVRLVSESGEVLAEAPVEAAAGRWNDVSLVISPKATAQAGNLAFAIKGSGDVSFDYVSLMPEERYAYEGGKLPFRKDVAEMLVGLKPKFVRWPGGCVVEGISLNDRVEWKKTLGDPATRPGIYDTWGYHASYGFGYHEMLCFCESIGAGGMFVCNVGIGCQYRQGDACSEEDIQFYIDDCLDAIEYALGPVDSEWGALRAQAGHPEPLPLKYVEIGNENWGAEYERRYDMFHEAIREKYPELILICNNRIDGPGSIKETDMIDPHWYVNPDYFFDNTHLFDSIERGSYTAYVGEYAANSGVGSGNMLAALSEAAWIGGMERNGDFVKMCSYAPLLENSNDRVWPVNLIWVNSSQVLGRSSYYVQKMAAENRPDYNVGLSACESAADSSCFYAAGFDEAASEAVIKVVNRSGEVFPLNVTLEGAGKVARSGKVITLAAENATDENTFEDTMKISPVESRWTGFGKNFTYELQPYSYTVLRVKVKK